MDRLELTNEFIKAHPTPEKTVNIHDSQIENLGIRIYESGNKSWIYRYSINGYSKRYTLGRFPQIGVTEARQEAHQLSKDVANGIDLNERKKRNKRKNNGTLFKEAIPKFKKIKFKTLRDSTKRTYRQILTNHMEPFHNRNLNDIDQSEIILFLDKNYVQKDKIYMANYIRRVLLLFWNFCKSRDYVQSNIITDTQPYPEPEKTEDEKERYLSFKELFKIWNASNEFPEPYQTYYKILILYGTRTTETLRLKWDDLSSQDKTLTIPSNLAKNGKKHVLPLTDRAQDLLLELHANYSGNSDFIFQSTTGSNTPLSSTDYYKGKMQDQTGITDYTNHLIRHSVASHMADLEVNPFSISYVLNHKIKNNVTERHYIKSQFIPNKTKALKVWHDNLFSEFASIDIENSQQDAPIHKEFTVYSGSVTKQSQTDDAPSKDLPF